MNGPKTMSVNVNLPVPPGMSKELAMAIFQALYNEVHEIAPLARPEEKIDVAKMLLADHHVLSQVRKAVLEAPPGAKWGVVVIEPSLIDGPGQEERGIYVEAFVRMDEAARHGPNEVMKTATCYSYMTSASTRALMVMQGYRLRFEPPFMPGGEDGVEG